MSYGTGAIMAVPGHDHRDWEFAKKYDLDIKPVIYPADGSPLNLDDGAYVEKGLLKRSGAFDGLTSEQAFAAVADHIEEMKAGSRRVNYRLRDWGISRQRYWGCPIPMMAAEDGDSIPVPGDELPVTLPEYVEFSGVRSPPERHG